MELKILKEDFLWALSRAQSVVEKRHTMPVLSNVLLSADKGTLTVLATDLEVGEEATIPAQVLQSGKITVLCRSLHDVVREMGGPEIKLTLGQNERIELVSGTARFSLPGLSAKEFPILPTVTNKPWILDCGVFGDIMKKTVYAISSDDTRHNLAGLFVHGLEGKRIRVVATDGHRLSLVERDLEGGDWAGVKVIIPRKGVSELRKLVSSGESFSLAIGDKDLVAKKDRESLHVRLVDSEYPDYERVVPAKNEKLVVVPRTELMAALRRVSILSSERSRAVVMAFSSGLLELSINNPDLGEACEEVAITYKGDKLAVGFNARYFLDILESMEDEKIVILLQSELTPCLIKSEKDRGFVGVVMPMRI